MYYAALFILAYLYLVVLFVFIGGFIKDKKLGYCSPKVSIVIAAWNEEKLIEKCLKSVLEQEYDNDFEVIVIGGGSDKTAEIVSKFKKVKFIREEKPHGKWGALNTAISKTKYEAIAMIDADAVAPKEWLRKIMAPLNKYDISTSTYINYNRNTIVSKAYYTFSTLLLNLEAFLSRFLNSAYANGANMAFKKKVWESVKFRNYLLEDIGFYSDARKKGFKKAFVPSAVIQVYGPTTYKNFSAQTGRFFRGVIQLLFSKTSIYEKYFYLQYILFFTAVPIIFLSFFLLYIDDIEKFRIIFNMTLSVASLVVFSFLASTKSIRQAIDMIISIPIIMIMSTAMFIEQIYLIIGGRFKEWTRMERV